MTFQNALIAYTIFMRKRKKTVIAIVAAVLSASTIGLVLLNLVTVDYLAEVETYAPENVRALALAVIKAESDFDARAKSKKGAIGLMQLMPDTANFVWLTMLGGKTMLTENDLYEPELNVKIGIRYLEYLLSKFDEKWAICAYNAGEGTVCRWISGGGQVEYEETRNYLKKVNFYKTVYQKAGCRQKRKISATTRETKFTKKFPETQKFA